MDGQGASYLLAIDAGGTGCRAAAGDAARGILGRATGGPGNVENGFDAAIATILRTGAAALAEAGLADVAPDRITLHLGAAGVNSPETAQRVAARLPYGRLRVTGDKDTTVAGALGSDDGFVLGIGTGTFIARQRQGEIRTVAGWGFALSDQASGAWLGHGALQRALLAHDGMADHSPLTRALLAQCGGLHGMLSFCLDAGPSDYATLAPQVLQAAQDGDPVACDLRGAAVRFLCTGLAALEFRAGDRLCLTGGVAPQYAAHLPAKVTTGLAPPEGNALDGAFALAAGLANGPD